MRGRRSRVEFCSVEKSNPFFAETAVLKIDVQQERSLWSDMLWALVCFDLPKLRLSCRHICLLNQDIFISLRECPETLLEMLDVFQGILGQSVYRLLIWLFLPSSLLNQKTAHRWSLTLV